MAVSIPQTQDDPLADWVEKNLFISKSYDKIPGSDVIQTMAKKASVELGDAITADDIINAMRDVKRRKNFDLERYEFD